MKILVVDDEALLVKGIRFNLQSEGYEVVTGSNGLEAVQLARDPSINLIVLDVMMPQMDGLTACSKIREFSDVPIIMLTAKVDDMDKLMGFDNGADDYLTKPFNILELKARIRALLRRCGAAPQSEAQPNQLTVGTITLDLDSRNAFKDGTVVELTAKEFDVIEFLMRNPNRVYSREALLDTIWAYEYRSDIRTVDVHIRRLREKLELNPAQPEYIMTKWGVGYYFRK
jgi:DNA-binding response OmpR family regulator